VELAPLLAHIVVNQEPSVSKALSRIRERMLSDMKKGKKVEIEYKLGWEDLLN
jgi:hypothetical protein